jgi:endonuclease/exonuclease/phosphatase family metal-dependent hydrolase
MFYGFTAFRFISALLILSFISTEVSGQKRQYKVAAIGFYNLENLFDTLDSKDTRDTEFTPRGSNVWDTYKYRKKLSNLSRVISELGTDITPDGLAILGVCEIENRNVLEDLVKQPSIDHRNYEIVHYESPDRRGIDNALLYNPKYFKPVRSRNIEVLIIEPKTLDTTYTRDILYVAGELDGELIHIMVNHWPSRSGGEKRSQYKRNYAASVVKSVADSLREADALAKIIVMGDLNDDPVSPSVRKVLNSNGSEEKVGPNEFFNPMYDSYRQGIGTLAWRDAWNLFDQILLSYGLMGEPANGYSYYKTVIYNERYLVQDAGTFKGYPYRTLAGGTYLGGYSDHFPVFVYLIKEI